MASALDEMFVDVDGLDFLSSYFSNANNVVDSLDTNSMRVDCGEYFFF
jgi:hypothetical protein